MIFRYKVTSRENYYLNYTEYNIKIQKHTSSIFHWETVEDIELRQLLDKIHKDEFGEFHYYSSIPETAVYDVLKKYNSMDEIIMKYITDVILKNYRDQEKAKQVDKAIGKFVMTNGWKTIEIKENEE